MTLDGLYTTEAAAAYLEISVRTLKKYLYEFDPPLLKPQRVGHTLVFTRDQLDNFKQSYKPQSGRPRKE